MFKHDKNEIFLDGFKVPLDVFMQLEPSYTHPNDLILMFYDGNRRHYRTKHKSWTVIGKWEDGDRYISRIDEFFRLMVEITKDNQEVAADVAAAKKDVMPKPDIKAKYPEEDTANVDLQQLADLKPSRIKRIRAQGKRSPRGGDKHSG